MTFINKNIYDYNITMTHFIVNPENGKTVSIFSHEGKRVLGNYLWTLKQSGGTLKRKPRRKYKKCRSCGRRYRQKGGAGADAGGGGGGGSGGGDAPAPPSEDEIALAATAWAANYGYGSRSPRYDKKAQRAEAIKFGKRLMKDYVNREDSDLFSNLDDGGELDEDAVEDGTWEWAYGPLWKTKRACWMILLDGDKLPAGGCGREGCIWCT